ncbi:MAG: hypothetical protein N0C84_07715 [Candidatus Thiodiazotropha taylori]|uniref:Uncharacterized protein n=1 Tax=Candidatus Thiodiazotropha taylori TaxID=2792791 RepID=A0A9E4KB56_9GAMM|nr:hypothetical protein [Candidatus Thiodiazotropha taylori]MCW4256339.1 hypothetical protein [Candidatus Thiodiazotropha taylori]
MARKKKGQKKGSIPLVASLEVPSKVVDKALGQLTDEAIEELLGTVGDDVDIKRLKKLLGPDSGTVRIGTMQDIADAEGKLGPGVVMTTGGGGYNGKLWEKATC